MRSKIKLFFQTKIFVFMPLYYSRFSGNLLVNSSSYQTQAFWKAGEYKNPRLFQLESRHPKGSGFLSIGSYFLAIYCANQSPTSEVESA